MKEKINRRRFLKHSAVASLALSKLVARGNASTVLSPASERPGVRPLVLWYDQPAAEWVEALPIGNGRLGAMIFGRTGNERL